MSFARVYVLALFLSVNGCKTSEKGKSDGGLKTIASPATSAVIRPQELHENISNEARINLLKAVYIADILSAPGHAQLREPQKVVLIADQIRNGNEVGFEDEPIVIGVFTDLISGSSVKVRSIEVLDGNHRLAGGLLSGKWKQIGNIPSSYLKILVNGWVAGGSGEQPRWIPLEVAEKSSIPKNEWFRVPDEWGAKGPTAQVSGRISSIDSVIPSQYRGVPMKEVLTISLRRINAHVPDWLR